MVGWARPIDIGWARHIVWWIGRWARYVIG